MPNLLREYIRELVSESYFPLEGGDKMRIHHSREGSRSGNEPQVSGFSQKIGNKPNGLWYECQDGSSETWKEFCEFGLSDGASRYDSSYNVALNDYNILFIPDESNFEKFYEMYSVDHPGGSKFDKVIDWPKVADHYAGIEICLIFLASVWTMIASGTMVGMLHPDVFGINQELKN